MYKRGRFKPEHANISETISAPELCCALRRDASGINKHKAPLIPENLAVSSHETSKASVYNVCFNANNLLNLPLK